MNRTTIKKNICLLFLTSLISIGFGQTKIVDSLKIELKNSKQDSKKIDILLSLFENYTSYNADSLLSYVNQAKAILPKVTDNKKKILVDYFYIIYLSSIGKTDTALVLVNNYLPILNKADTKDLYKRFTFYKSRLYIRNNQQKQGLEISFKLLEMAEKDADTLMQERVISQIGWAYMELGQNREALHWFFKRLELTPTIEGKKNLASNYSNMAAVYNELKQNDSAEYFILIAIDYAKKYSGLIYLANAYFIYADICIDKGNLEKAESLMIQGLAIRKQIGDDFYLVSDITQLGLFYAKNNQPQKGIEVIQEGIIIANKNHYEAKLPILYDALAKNYKAANNLAKYSETLEKIISLKDSLYTKNSAEALGSIQNKYEIQKKENQIATQKIELLQKKIWLYISFLMTALGILIFAYFFNKYKKKQKEKNDAATAEQQLVYNQQLKKAEENERKRIAAELHDNLGVQANTILYNTSLLNKNNDKTIVETLNDTAKEMLLNLRETLWAMKSEALSSLDVWHRIANFCQQMSRQYKNINILVEGEPPLGFTLESPKALNVIMISQEAINNALKHSDADTIKVNSSVENSNWVIQIIDNGKGYEIEQESVKKDSYGITNMKERATTSQINLAINSIKNNGTIIVLKTPISTKSNV